MRFLPGPARQISQTSAMATWLFSGSAFSIVWSLGLLIAAQSRGRLRSALAPAGILFCAGVWLVSGGIFLSGSYPPLLFGFHLPTGYLIGPLVLYYARTILRSSAVLRGIDALHLLPAVAALASLVFYHTSSAEEQNIFRQGHPWFLALNAGLKVSVLIYKIVVTAMFLRTVPRDLRYLPLMILYGVIVLDLGVGVAGYLTNKKELIVASAAGLPAILYTAFLASCRWPEIIGSLRADVSRRRYEKTRLLGLDVGGVVEELRRLMEEEKAFSDEDLTLSGLARELGITPHQLSQILNERLQKSFSLFVNEYRVMEARELIAKEPQRSLLSVCHACGFNSKSSFNRAFRQICSETPQQFRQGLAILSGIEK